MRMREGLGKRGATVGILLLLTLIGVAATGCAISEARPEAFPTAPPTSAPSATFTVGDIDPDEPAKKIKRFQSLADYLAESLGGSGFGVGRVVVARNVEEMARFLKDGTVDLYLDSPAPALAVQERSDSEFVLRRSKDGYDSYWSTLIVLSDSGIGSVEDLLGKIVAFEEPHSTSGFMLPAGTLLQRGFTLTELSGPGAEVPPGEIGYMFSGDEQNTLELVLQGRVAAGGFSSQDLDELPPDIAARVTGVGRTMTIPRQLVSLRSGLDPALVRQITDLLLGLEQTEAGREMLLGMKDSRFDPLPPDTEATLADLKVLSDLAASN